MVEPSHDEMEVERANALLESKNPNEVRLGMKIVEERALHGDVYSIYTLAKWYRTGFGGYSVDPERDDELTATAAAALVPDAIYDLGAKADGRDINQRKRAFGYYIVSAIMGDIEAINAIIDLLENTDTIGRQPDVAVLLRRYVSDVDRG